MYARVKEGSHSKFGVYMNSSVTALCDQIDTVIESIDLIRKGSVLRRSEVVTLLNEVDTDTKPFLSAVRSSTFKTFPDVLEGKAGVIANVTTCLSLATMLKDKKIQRPAFLKKLSSVKINLKAVASELRKTLDYLPEEDTTIDEADKAISRREARENAASSKTSRMLEQMRSAYSHKVPKKLTGCLHFCTLPVMARFGNMGMNPENLSRMGFTVHSAGLHSAQSSDIGMVIEEQLLMFFRMSDALENSEDTAKKFKSGGVNAEKSDLQKRRNAERRELRALTKLHEEATKPSTQKILMRQIRESNKAIDEFTDKLEKLTDSIKVHNSTARVHRQTQNTTEISILNYAAPILESLNSNGRSSTEYGLFTTKPLSGLLPDSDVYALWLMPTPTIKLLLQHSHGDTKLETWFLPWHNGRR